MSQYITQKSQYITQKLKDSEKFSIKIQNGEDWKKMAVELIKNGYSVCLDQTRTYLNVERAWVYPKDSNE